MLSVGDAFVLLMLLTSFFLHITKIVDTHFRVYYLFTSSYWIGKYIGGNVSPRCKIAANGSPAYCIELGGYLPGGSTVSTRTAHVWNGFSSDKRDAIKVAPLCSEPGNSSALSGNFGSQ